MNNTKVILRFIRHFGKNLEKYLTCFLSFCSTVRQNLQKRLRVKVRRYVTMPPGAEGSRVISSANEKQASCKSSSPHRLNDIRQIYCTSIFTSLFKYYQNQLPSQQSVRRLLCQHRGCCHAAVAEPQFLDNVSPRSEGDTHRCGNSADIILSARRLFECGDELSLRKKRTSESGQRSIQFCHRGCYLPSCCMGSRWTAGLPAVAESSSCNR